MYNLVKETMKYTENVIKAVYYLQSINKNVSQYQASEIIEFISIHWYKGHWDCYMKICDKPFYENWLHYDDVSAIIWILERGNKDGKQEQ